MKKFIFGLALVVLTGAIYANEPSKLITPDSELAAALKHKYSKVAAEDLDYAYYFTMFTIPEKIRVRDEEVPLRQHAEWALSFVLNSCASARSGGYIEKPKRVPGSQTLWYIDIRDYGWAKSDVDTVFAIQPYFLAPLVDAKENSILFRADWFIVNAMDVTKQDDRGIKDIVYYILQYGKGHEPKNAADFEKAWLVDIKTIRTQKLETGTIVDTGDSGVSQHNRQLRRGRTILGYFWSTRDVKSHDLDPDQIKSRDYIEDIFANQADAGEYIASMKNGLQTYFLTAGNNDNFKEVKFGDPTVVIDRQDHRDSRVRTAKSCVVCHANGIIPYTNAIRELFQTGGDLRAKNKELSLAIKAFYLKNDGSEVEDDNRIFERAIKQCNGLDPADNMKAYLNVYDWYWGGKVTLEQAALEFGMTTDVYKGHIKKTTTGRLTQLFYGKPLPREVWDSVNAGGYVQSALLMKRVNGENKKTEKPKQAIQTVVVSVPQAILYGAGNKVLGYLTQGTKVTVLRVHKEEWYWVRHGQVEGYLEISKTVKAEESP